MKEGSNNSDKMACPRSGDESRNLFETTRKKHIVRPVYGGPFVLYINKHCPQQVVANAHDPVSTQNQQLPIKDELSRQSWFEKNTSYSFQNNTLMM